MLVKQFNTSAVITYRSHDYFDDLQKYLIQIELSCLGVKLNNRERVLCPLSSPNYFFYPEKSFSMAIIIKTFLAVFTATAVVNSSH